VLTPPPVDRIPAPLARTFDSAEVGSNPDSLPLHAADSSTEFTIPQLADYELVVLEPQSR
jgi:hypothetical protein